MQLELERIYYKTLKKFRVHGILFVKVYNYVKGEARAHECGRSKKAS